MFGRTRVVTWKLIYTHQAKKDAKKLAKHNLKAKALIILETLQKNPLAAPYEKLTGDLTGAYSRRINIQHRMVYQIYRKEKIIKIIRMWTHYE